MYPETTQRANFALDKEQFFADKTCFIMITKYPSYIQSTLSSHLFEFAYKRIYSSVELGLNGYQYNKHALIKLPIKLINEDIDVTNEEVYQFYNINDDEIIFIESQYNQ